MTDVLAAAVDSPSLDCEQTVRRLWDYLDGQLGATDVALIDAHLAACDRCPPHFEFERRFLDTVRRARRTDGAATRSDALRARVVAMLIADGWLPTRGGAA